MALIDPALDFAAPLTGEIGLSLRVGQENSRLQAIAEALPDQSYDFALAIGSTLGLARKLSGRCVRLELTLGRDPTGVNLIIASDCVAGLDQASRMALLEEAVGALKPGGHLVLAHWLDEEGADEDAAAFIALAEDRLLPVSRRRTPHYRIDVLERA
jgi:hypothetical protein